MSAEQKPKSLQALLDTVPNIVDHLFRNPPKAALNVFTVLMPAEVVKPEFTTWRDEQRSWRETVALHDQTWHMHSLNVRGRDALRVFERLAVNSFKTFTPGAAKQFLACSPEGYVIGDGILYFLDVDNMLLVGNPATTDWAQYNAERGGYDVKVELDPLWALNRARKRNFYRYQVEGPHALRLLERLHGGALPEIKFFRSGTLNIAGCKVRAMRHSMGGVPGLELSGPWEERDRVRGALIETGQNFGLRQIGSLAYFSTVIETGWWAVPFSAIYTSPELREYREWLSTSSAAARMSLGGSFYSPNVEDYYATPWDIGLGHLIKFDHDFIGRPTLERMADMPHRRKVTLVWNPEDVLKVFQRLLEDGSTAMHVDLPVSAAARLHYDKVLDKNGKFIGLAHYPGYTINERAMMSLGSVKEEHAEPGTEVVLVWGEEGGGKKSAPWIEPHVQVRIRATVAPSPISQAAQDYRTVLNVRRQPALHPA
ncbi:MAG: aminomethyl transferase family protein [Xanthobacteraceae bacterium]